MKKEDSPVLIDTSAWIDFFKGKSAAADVVAGLIEKGQAAICGVVYYELLQGAKSDDEAMRLTNALSALNYFEMTTGTWKTAGAISSGLHKKGVTLPMSDILIGAIALDNDTAVLTLDGHFSNIPGIKRHKE